MNIGIHDPALERQVHEAMNSGRFHNFEEMLAWALGALSVSDVSGPSRERRSSMALVEAMQASPFKEIDLEPR